MHGLSHQPMLGMQKNDLTVSEAAWALTKLINGPRPHSSPTSSFLLVPPPSKSSPDSMTFINLLPNDAHEQKLQL